MDEGKQRAKVKIGVNRGWSAAEIGCTIIGSMG